MMVMPSNCSGTITGRWSALYPNRIGFLFSPAAKPRGSAWDFFQHAIDNGAYPLWQKGLPFDEVAFLKICEWSNRSGQKPLWCLVPDVVCDANATLRNWEIWHPRLKALYPFWKFAFAAQDGMLPGDAPEEADVIFLGGSDEWKYRSISPWCARYPWVHVGRINYIEPLWKCHDAGAKSCDGTGWFRGDQRQLRHLETYLRQSSGIEQRPNQLTIPIA